MPLKEEIDLLDDYLDIEVVRFGRDKLRIHKELDSDSLSHLVPSMILQPLVENAIKHGLADKLDGGNVYIRSRCTEQRVIIEVEDDGVGMAASAGKHRHRYRHDQCAGAVAGSLRRCGRDQY